MRILIIRISALGDAIHTLPAIDIFKKTFPDAQIDWLVQQKIIGIVRHIPGLHKIHVLSDHYLRPTHLGGTIHLFKDLRQSFYDLIIDFQGLCKTSLLILGINAPSIGFGWKSAREPLSSLAQTYVINPAVTSTIIDKNIALACAAINILRKILPPPPAPFEDKKSLNNTKPFASTPQASPQAKARITAWLATQPSPRLILLAPNTTWTSKHWPLMRWQELASTIALPDHTIVLIGQHFGTQGRELAAFIEHNNLPITIAPPWTLEEIFAVIPHATAIVAPDTGLLHIADCMGIATIGIYGPTLVTRHGPLITPGNRAHCFQVNCPHKYEKTHSKSINPGDITDCMLMLGADEVAKKIIALIHKE